MQLVDSSHQREIAVGGRLRLVVHRRARHVEQLRLTHDGQPVVRIDHRFALASPMRPSALVKKSISNALLTDLGVQRFQIRARVALLRRRREHLGGAFEQLRSLLADLVGMNLELLGELDQGPIASDRGQRHFRLERR